MSFRTVSFFVSLMVVVGFSLTAVGQPVEAAEYELDPQHNSAIFEVTHLDLANIFGMFTEWTAEAEYDPDAPEETTLNVVVQTASVFTNERDRDDHLRSPDFFNASEHPEMTFESTEVEAEGEDLLHVTGDFTLRGTTREKTIPVQLTGAGENPGIGEFVRGFRAEFTVDRMAYGVDFMPDGLSHDVQVTLTGEMIQQ